MLGDQGHKRQLFKGTDINLRRLLKLQNQTLLHKCGFPITEDTEK